MVEPKGKRAKAPGLNPALKSEIDSSHDTRRSPAPLETTGAKEGQGEGWPLIWLVVTVVCIVLAVYFLL